MRARLSLQRSGQFRLEGQLTSDTAMPLLLDAANLFDRHVETIVDLSGVTQSNSGGLALLLEWDRLAHLDGGSVRYRKAPKKLLALASLSDLEQILIFTK